jgi:hypothetical protein
MNACDFSMLDAEQGVAIVWGWALRRLPGGGMICAMGF